jgi:signal-transduction protein with cAMP-binding, CBS, and nucleotidyltransferase domain
MWAGTNGYIYLYICQARVLFLQQTAPFSELPADKFLAVAQALSVRWFRDGEQIMTQGEPGTCLYVIKQGRVVCTHHTEKGGSLVKTLRVEYGEGEYFGEGSVLHCAPRMADVHATGDVICYTLTSEDFKRLLGDVQGLFDVHFTAKVLKGVKLLGEYRSNPIRSIHSSLW